MKHHNRNVYGGVDTHQDVHVAAVIDEVGTLLSTRAFPITTLGLTSLQRWLSRFGHVIKVGVEGTGSYGLGLQRVLQAAGHEVVEVNRPNRQLRRSKGKSDTVDAEAAARAVLAGYATITPKSHDGIVEAIRVVLVAHTSTRQALQKIDGRIRSLLISAPEPVRIQFTGLTAHAAAATAARLRPGTDHADITTATKVALRTLGRQRQQLGADLAMLEAELEQLTTQANPGLRQVRGVGPIVAGTLLVAAGDNPERLATPASFAALCGVSPISASSGKTTAMRLNRGGNRQANSALFRIVLVRRSQHDPRTMDYFARRRAEGKRDLDIMRRLKTYVAREIYQHLTNPQPAIRTDDLRARRQAIKRPMREVADTLGAAIMSISCLERGTNHDPDLAQRYRTWLNQQEIAS